MCCFVQYKVTQAVKDRVSSPRPCVVQIASLCGSGNTEVAGGGGGGGGRGGSLIRSVIGLT